MSKLATAPKSHNYLLGTLCFLLIGFGVALPRPALASAVGSIPGQFSIDASGSAHYSIPLAIPPGINGLQPRITLSYNSQASESIAGYGWGLSSFSSITRCANTIADDGQTRGINLDAQDRFCLDGQKLRLVSGTYGSDAEYRTEINNFFKVTSYTTGGDGSTPTSGPQYFEVQTPDGKTYYYGKTTDSRIYFQGTTVVFTWALDEVVDGSGNYITFAYDNDATTGDYYPSEIDYTGNSLSAPQHAIVFSYEDLPAAGVSDKYIAGHLIQRTQILDKIDINYGGATLLHYDLTYDAQPNGHSRLTQVTECAGSGTSNCFLPTTIDWQNGSQAWDSATASGTTGSTPESAHAIDLNGDGFADLVWPDGSSWEFKLGSSSGFGNARVLTDIPTATYTPSSAQAFSLTGNGRTGLLVDDTVTHEWVVLTLNTAGTDFDVTSTNLSDSGDQDIMGVVDYNGDGRDDLLWAQSSDYTVKVAINNGGTFAPAITVASGDATDVYGLKLTNSSIAPDPAFTDEPADFNGDGRTDRFMVMTKTITSTYCQPPDCTNPAPPTVEYFWDALEATDAGYVSIGTFEIGATKEGDPPPIASYPMLVDVNGDGLTDAIIGNTVEISTGSGFVGVALNSPCGGPQSAIPFGGEQALLVQCTVGWDLLRYANGGFIATPVDAPSGMSTPMAMDVNGDGLADFVFAGSDGNWYYAPHSGVKPDLVSKVSDGLGNYFAPTYGPLTNTGIYAVGGGTSYPQQDVRSSMYVVTSYTTNDGIGGSYEEQYQYKGARADLTGGGFLGFEQQTAIDTRTGVKAITTYRQDFPYVGHISDVVTEQSDGTSIAETSNVWSDTATGSATDHTDRYFVYLPNKTEEIFAVGGKANGSLVKDTTTKNTFDAYGNPKVVEVDSTAGGSTFKSITTRSFVDNTAAWCLSLPTDSQLSNTGADGSTATRHTQYIVDPATCRTTSETSEPGTSLAVTTDYQFNAAGNPTSVTVTGSGMAARVTKTTYTTDGGFPISVTNPLDQVSGAEWDEGFGVQTSATDVNGHKTQWTYDAFARKASETTAAGATTTWTYALCSSDCGVANGRYELSTDTTDSAGDHAAQSSIIYDQKGRPVGQTALRLGGGTAFVDTIYDNLGRTVKQSQPYYSGNTIYWTTTTYDLLDRPLEVTQPDGAATKFDYEGLSTTITDPKLNTTTQARDALGRIVAVTDAAGQTTTYDYDEFGNVTGITDALTHKTTIGYDIDGHKTSMVDPDMGHWTYGYDALGELISQTDAKNQTTTQTYDALGRITSRTEPQTDGTSGTTTWTYDTAANGVGLVAKIVGPHGFEKDYSYDSLSRPSDVTTIVDGTANTISTTYDAFGRIASVEYPQGTTPPADNVPVANAGSDQTVLVGAVVTLQGTASDADSGQTLTYRWQESDSSPFVQLADLHSLQPTFTAASPGVYDFTLYVGDGTYSASDSVEITVTPPAPASIATNETTSYDGSFTLSWGAADGADCYQIQESTSATFTDPAVACTTTTTTTSNDYTGYADGSYYYRVRAIGGNVPGPWSATAIVNVKHPPSVPAAPSFNLNPTANGAYTVQWVKPSGLVAEYRLEEAANGGGWTEVYAGLNLSWPTSGRGAGSYAYRLRACSDTASTASCSGYSATATETVLGPPSTPAAPTFNTSLSTNGAYTVYWTQPGGAVNQVRYHLQEAVSGGSWTEKYHGANRSWATSGWGDGQYYYRVIACNSDAAGHEQCSGPSANGSITVTLPPPAPSASRSPTGTILSGTRYTVSWTQPSGPIGHYEIEGAWPTSTFSGATPVNVGLARSKTYTAGTVNDYGDEYSRVRACNVAGCGAWSNTIDVLIHTPTSGGGGGGGGGGCDPTCPQVVGPATVDGPSSSTTQSASSPSTTSTGTTSPSAPLPPPPSDGSGGLTMLDVGQSGIPARPRANLIVPVTMVADQSAATPTEWRAEPGRGLTYAPPVNEWLKQVHVRTVSTSTTGYRFAVKYEYDPASGALERVVNANDESQIYWEAPRGGEAPPMDAAGRMQAFVLGNDVATVRAYDQATGRLEGITSGVGATDSSVQNVAYTWDADGNQTQRQDYNQNLIEKFDYDSLNRLTTSTLTAGGTTAQNLSLTYDEIGNIQTKSGVGTYSYDPNHPHAVASVSGTVNTGYTYDADGNTLTGNGKSYGWTAFNKPFEIVQGNAKTDFWYAPDRSRYEQVATAADGTITTTIYIGGLAKIVSTGGLTSYKHLIVANGETIAVETERTNSTQDLRYLSYDALGSLAAITDETGAVVARASFDAFGQRRDALSWSGPPTNLSLLTGITPIGYTGHEELDSVGLVHMNGRVYDSEIGRFVSADPTLQYPYNPQDLNRYSYVVNNPLTYNDPSGFGFLSGLFHAVTNLVSSVTSGVVNLASNILSIAVHPAESLEYAMPLVGHQINAMFARSATLRQLGGYAAMIVSFFYGPEVYAGYEAYITDVMGGTPLQDVEAYVGGYLQASAFVGLANGAMTAYGAGGINGIEGLAEFAGKTYFNRVSQKELARIAERNGMTLGQLDLYLFALSEIGNNIPGIGTRFRTTGGKPTFVGWNNRGVAGYFFDAADTLLEYQGIPSASAWDYVFSSYQGVPISVGHSLGALTANNLVYWGAAPSANVYALPFFNVGTGGTSVTISSGDAIAGSYLGKLLNPSAHVIDGSPFGHAACSTYGVLCSGGSGG